jgi:F420-0:gamma-glutamyl ligase-like protein
VVSDPVVSPAEMVGRASSSAGCTLSTIPGVYVAVLESSASQFQQVAAPTSL